MENLLRLTNLTVDFRPPGSTMLWGPIPWQHSWQIVWVKNDSKSTRSCCSFDMHASAIGRRICLNLVQSSCNTRCLKAITKTKWKQHTEITDKLQWSSSKFWDMKTYFASETFFSITIDVPRSFTMRSSFGKLNATVWGPFTS